MRMVIDGAHPDDGGCPPRWNRCERAERDGHDRKGQAQGVSQRQAAKALQGPRTTLHAWRRWHETLASCPPGAQLCQHGPGLACLHRLVLALQLVCVAVGACGLRLVGLFLTLTGLDRCVAASSGAQQQGNRQIDAAIVSYRHAEPARWATAMPRQDMTLPQDAPFPGVCAWGDRRPCVTVFCGHNALGLALQPPGMPAWRRPGRRSTARGCTPPVRKRRAFWRLLRLLLGRITRRTSSMDNLN
jgi:hypothetical protein